MKRTHIMIRAALARLTSGERMSRAVRLRAYMGETHVRALPALEDDPIWGLVGTVDAEPAVVDDIVYRG